MEILLNAEAKFPKEGQFATTLRVILPTRRNRKKLNALSRAFETHLDRRKAAIKDDELKSLWNSPQIFSARLKKTVSAVKSIIELHGYGQK